MATILPRIAAMALVFCGAATLPSTPTQAAENAAADTPAVVMYATKTCGYCAKAREYFKAHGVALDERDVETSVEAAREWKALGGTGTPIIVIGDEHITGFHQARINAALAKRGALAR